MWKTSYNPEISIEEIFIYDEHSDGYVMIVSKLFRFHVTGLHKEFLVPSEGRAWAENVLKEVIL